ncbi:MAG: hypothetical protein ABIM49_01685 [candidate division WOR-3 bacterium]
MKNYKDFFDDLKKGEIKKIIIFEGKDTYLMKKAWEALCKSTNSEYHFYILDDIKTQDKREEFLKKFSEPDVFSPKRKVFVLYLDKIPAYLKIFLKNIEEDRSNNILVLLISETEYNKQVFLNLNKYEIYSFDGVEENEGYRWISKEFSKNGKIVSPKIIRFILELSKKDLGIMNNIVQVLSLASEEKSISSISYLKDILKERYSLKEFVDSIKPGEKIHTFLKKLYNLMYKEEEINFLLNIMMKRLYNNRKQFVNEKFIYDFIYDLFMLQKEKQTKICNGRLLFLTGLMKVFLKKEVHFGISGT